MSGSKMLKSLAAFFCFAASLAGGEVTNPVYRVAEEQTAATPRATDSHVQTALGVAEQMNANAVQQTAGVTPGLEKSPFDLVQRDGEHPLMPCIRLAKQGLAEMDANIQDYSAVMTKLERIDGKLGEPQHIEVKVRHQPFSVYMKFITPKTGQEALYVENQNNGKLVAMGSGFLRKFGKQELGPTHAWAMKGQLYPITMTGMRNLTTELLKIAEEDVKYGECEVRYADSTINQRPCTMIEARHPIPRRNFRFNVARIFIDNEMRIPVAYEAYLWPATEGGAPELAERYIYTDIKLNNGYTDADFDKNNPNMFQ